jgi:hypothetical protein
MMALRQANNLTKRIPRLVIEFPQVSLFDFSGSQRFCPDLVFGVIRWQLRSPPTTNREVPVLDELSVGPDQVR